MAEQLVSIQDAARQALADWLNLEFNDIDGVVIEPDWFETDRQLPAKAISIIDAGPRQIEWLQPDVVDMKNVGSTKVDAAWALGQITQAVQLDVWARSKPELSNLTARLDQSLNKGSLGIGVRPDTPFAVGVLLNLQDGWDPATVDFTFDEVTVNESASSVGEGEWRATYRGEARALLVQRARTARIARIRLKERLRRTDAIDSADPYDVTNITDSISSLPLTGFWNDFPAAPWVGAASAGVSAGRTMTGSAIAGAPLNGHPTVHIQPNTQLGTWTPSTPSSYFNASAWSLWILANVGDVATFGYVFITTDDEDNLDIILRVQGGQLTLEQLQTGGGSYKAASVAIVKGWSLIQAKFDGTRLNLRVNDGPWSSVVSTPPYKLNGTMALGLGLNLSADMTVADIATANISIADGTFDEVGAYATKRYALQLSAVSQNN